jgi:prophage antirepressor-like protein
MKKVQLFHFEAAEIRTMTDESGGHWFAAKDVFAALDIHWNGKRSLEPIRKAWQLVVSLATSNGNRSTTFISEAAVYKLAFRSSKEEAERFTDWIAEEVLPTLRKTGTYSLGSQLLPAPRVWEKTFPSEFMRNVLKLYGQKYDAKKGTPQFVGHFINKYVYNCMDKNMTRELKGARNRFGDEDEVAFLHQFLAEPAREALQSHIVALNTLMSASSSKDHFELMFDRVYTHKNQLEMLLR